MDIQEFINLCAGKWFSQRTSYQLAAQKVANNKAEITIDLLAADAADVVQLCLENNCQSQASLGGWKATWDNSVDYGQPKKIGSKTEFWMVVGLDSGMNAELRTFDVPEMIYLLIARWSE